MTADQAYKSSPWAIDVLRYRSPLLSLTTTSIHLKTSRSSMRSQPSSSRATIGASKRIASSVIVAGKVTALPAGEGSGELP